VKLFIFIFACLLATLSLSARAITNIRILTMYTPQAQAASGDIVSRVNSEIASLNLAFSRSGLGSSISAVNAGVVLITGPKYEASSAAGVHAAAVQAMGSDFRILQTRQIANADVVMMLTLQDDPQSDGKVLGIYGDPGYLNAWSAFAVVTADPAASLVFQHEFGHMLGARHAAAGTDSNDPTNPTWPYAHGYSASIPPTYSSGGSLLAGAYCFHTIMSSGYIVPTYCPVVDGRWYPILNFSNPAVTFTPGVPAAQPTGTGSANNASVLAQTAPIVGNYRNTNLVAARLFVFTLLDIGFFDAVCTGDPGFCPP
jgi:hypothetical protein